MHASSIRENDLTTDGIIIFEDEVEGYLSQEVEGNLVGADVFINKNTVFIKLKRRKNSKIKGTLFAVDEVDINKVIVEEDVKGKDVTIGPYSEVKGTVYYVNKIDVHKSAKLTTEPVQISEDQLKL